MSAELNYSGERLPIKLYSRDYNGKIVSIYLDGTEALVKLTNTTQAGVPTELELRTSMSCGASDYTEGTYKGIRALQKKVNEFCILAGGFSAYQRDVLAQMAFNIIRISLDNIEKSPEFSNGVQIYGVDFGHGSVETTGINLVTHLPGDHIKTHITLSLDKDNFEEEIFKEMVGKFFYNHTGDRVEAIQHFYACCIHQLLCSKLFYTETNSRVSDIGKSNIF